MVFTPVEADWAACHAWVGVFHGTKILPCPARYASFDHGYFCIMSA